MLENSRILIEGEKKGIAVTIFNDILPALFGFIGLMCAVSLVWLLFVGEWRFVVLGIIVGIVFPWVEPIAFLPAAGLIFLGNFLRKKVFIVGFLLALIAIIYQQLLMVAWSFLVMTFATSYSDHYILLIIFGLSVVMGPLTYMAQNDEGLGTVMGLLVAFVSYVIQAIFFLSGGMAIFVWCLLIFLIATISVQGVAAYKSLKVIA